MRFVVCVKQVPDTAEVKVDPRTNTLNRKGVPSIVNPYDMHAVEEAVRWKEALGGEVILISMGPPQAEKALRKALELGADRAILLTDRAFAGSDTLATSYVLALAIRSLGPVDLILCGKQAIDGDTGQVGPGIARRLRLPQLTYVLKIESLDRQEIVVWRKLADGRERVRARLPALVTVVKDINTIRYAPLPNLIQAQRAEVEVWGAADLEVDRSKVGLKGSPTQVVKIFPPPGRPGGEVLNPDGREVDAAVAQVVDNLVTRKIISNR